jgi:hypothetical protein
LAHGTIFLNVIHSLLHHVARVETTNMHVTIFVQHLKEDILAIDCNYIKNSIILRWREGNLMQAHIDKASDDCRKINKH